MEDVLSFELLEVDGIDKKAICLPPKLPMDWK